MAKEKIKSDEDEIIFDSNMVVIVVEGGMVTKIHSGDANARYVIVDIDNRKVGENLFQNTLGRILSLMMRKLKNYWEMMQKIIYRLRIKL